MSMEQKLNLNSMNQDWENVGNNIYQAMQEIATELGGELFANELSELVVSDTNWPSPDAFKRLEDRFPGSTSDVLERSSQIQKDNHRQELKDLRNDPIKRFGRSIVKVVKRNNITTVTKRKEYS